MAAGFFQNEEVSGVWRREEEKESVLLSVEEERIGGA